MTNVAVILSGCGYLDGAEIRESVLTLLYLDQQNTKVQIFAPDIDQHHVVNHLSGEETGETRNVLLESARIARGQVKPLSDLDVGQFDALLIPGGYGVAKNLSDLAFKGGEAAPLPDFADAVNGFYMAGKPIGAICITPAVVAAILKGQNVTLTIGEDEGTASVINGLGCNHKNAASDDVVVDKEHKIASCSAYMREDSLSAIAKGIEKVVYETLEMTKA